MEHTRSDIRFPTVDTLAERLKGAARHQQRILGHLHDSLAMPVDTGAGLADDDLAQGAFNRRVADWFVESEHVLRAMQNNFGALTDLIQGLQGALGEVEIAIHKLEGRQEELASALAIARDVADQLLVQQRQHRQEAIGLLDERTGELAAQIATLAARSEQLEDRAARELDTLRMRLVRSERLTDPHEAAEAVEGEPIASLEGDLAVSGIPAAPLSPPLDYFHFEQEFRGSTADIKRRQAAYVDLFLGKARVVDLGAGRGEFVELLVERGIGIVGVDINRDMVAFCRDRNLPVVQAEASAYLLAQPDASLDGVFAAQVIEHLPPDQLRRLLTLCGRKLASGGCLVLETVNSDCPTALSNFFLDPTHLRPVPPRLLRYLVEIEPFAVRHLQFSAPLPGRDRAEILRVTEGWPAAIVDYQDYAVIASRR